MKPPHLTPRETLLWILVPLLLTLAGMRLFLHLVRVQHVYPFGLLVHHLYTGCLIVLPAAFVLAFGPRRRWSAILTRIALGAGSAMILDEIVYLVATRATDADYVSALSLKGAFIFTSLAVALLLVLSRERK
jgi:hypothetical protein